MAEDFKEKHEEGGLIERFEGMLASNTIIYFLQGEYNRIIKHYRRHELWHKELIACEYAADHYPFQIDYVLGKIGALTNMDRVEEAFEVYYMSQTKFPNDMELLLAKANLLSFKGEYDAASEILQDLLIIYDEKDEILFQLGVVWQTAEQHKKAVKYFKMAMKENPDNANPIYELAYSLDVLGAVDDSIRYYTAYLDKEPFVSHAWYNLGIVYNKIEAYGLAINAYDYALAIDEKFSSAWFNKGNSFLSLEKYSDALECFVQTLTLEGPSAEIYCQMATCYEQFKQYDLGIQYYRKATKIDILHHNAFFGIGICFQKKEEWHQAAHFFNKAIEIDSENATYWYHLAAVEFELGNVISSVDAFEESCILSPDMAWLDWSLVYYEQGQHIKAFNIVSRGLEELPYAAELYYRACVYLISEGKYKEAFQYLENGLILDFDKHTILFDFFPKLETQKALYRIIEQFQTNN